MAMRLTGLYSGMDTESIIQELVAVKQTKVDAVKKDQTRLEWKQEAWKELNTKIKTFYNSTLDNLRFQGSYAKKTTAISDSSIAEILTGDSAMNSVQKLKVDKLAQTGYLTGAEITKADGTKATSGTKLVDLGEKSPIEVGSKIEVNVGGKTTEIEVTADMTLGNFTDALKNAGLNANFDSKTQRLFIGAKESGKDADFTITASNDKGTDALSKMGILVYDEDSKSKYQEYVDMATDGTKKQSVLDAETAVRLAKYISKRDSLQAELDTIKDKFESDDADEFDNLVNNKDGALDTLKQEIADAETKITELEQRLEDDTLTEAERDDLEAELKSLKEDVEVKQAKLDAVESYQSTRTELDNVSKYITQDADGNDIASDDLTTEVTSWLDGKIATAQSVLNGSLAGSEGAHKTRGQDAEIYLNGALFTSEDNTFEINGLTINCNAETDGEEITLTTKDDTSGIYDMIKNFITEYSKLINEMDKLYNAEDAKDYDPLTDEEKDSLSEKEVEKWEQKIKDSILRKDSTLNNVSSAFKEIMSSGFTVGGKTMFLSDFGVETLGYFEAADNERNAYHIHGDEDDSTVSSKTNKLKNMISTDVDSVMDFFTQLTNKLYDKTTSMMASVKDYSSAFTIYEDKKMKSEYDDYTKKIAELEEKLLDYEDKWYAKFSAMETAMAKMQDNSSAVTSLLGGL